jgi:hypothetical protein
LLIGSNLSIEEAPLPGTLSIQFPLNGASLHRLSVEIVFHQLRAKLERTRRLRRVDGWTHDQKENK